MPPRTDPTTLQLGDSVVIETSVDQVLFGFRGQLSSLLPTVVWVDVAEPGCPPLVRDLKEGHPVRLSAGRKTYALIGETTFRSSLGLSRRLVALERPSEMRLVDRRAQLRVATRRSVGIRLARDSAAGDGGRFSIGTALDISLTGMCLETTAHMAVGDRVFVTMVLQENQPLYAPAQIVRLEDATADRATAVTPRAMSHEGRKVSRASVRWQTMSPADRERLQNFLVHVEKAAAG